MAYEELQSNVEQVSLAAGKAAAVYLGGPGDAGADATVSSFSSSVDDRWVAADPKLRAALDAAIRGDAFERSAPEEIHDLHGNLLFRDFVLLLDPEQELRVRTSANKALGVLIVSVSVGRALNRARLIADAIERALQLGLGVPLEPARVVCYAYPRLGIVVSGRGDGPAAIDLTDHSVQSLREDAASEQPWELWEPLRGLPADAAKAAASKYEAEAMALEQGEMPGFEAASEVLGTAAPAPERLDRHILLPLIAQESDHFCAPAASQMILRHHGIVLDQQSIARKMGDIAVIELEGTTPSGQVAGLNAICRSIGLVAEPIFASHVEGDWSRALPRLVSEISANRPIQRQLKRPLHVDVIAGLRGVPGANDFMLRILDPRKPAGEERLDRWEMVKTNINDLILLHPPLN